MERRAVVDALFLIDKRSFSRTKYINDDDLKNSSTSLTRNEKDLFG